MPQMFIIRRLTKSVLQVPAVDTLQINSGELAERPTNLSGTD